jgi:hypothetical protein
MILSNIQLNLKIDEIPIKFQPVIKTLYFESVIPLNNGSYNNNFILVPTPLQTRLVHTTTAVQATNADTGDNARFV